MKMNKKNSSYERYSYIFIIIPIVLLLFGYYLFPYPHSDYIKQINQIPLFVGLIILLIGFLLNKKSFSSIIKSIGWIVFAFYWATQPLTLYYSEGGDIVNAVICILGIFVLSYIAYHEFLSYIRDEKISCINWIAGASAISGLIYFGIERSPIALTLIHEVAKQSAWVLEFFIGEVSVGAPILDYGAPITQNGEAVVNIIFACTAIQSFVIFIGMILALPKIDMKRRIIGLIITIIPVYILNLFRNAMVAFLSYRNITDFNIAHNYIAKAGSLIALIVLLVILIKIIPEVLDEIFCLTDLYKRNGPIEKIFSKIWSKK